MLAAINVFLLPKTKGRLIVVALLSLAAFTSGGLIALSLPVILTSYCALQVYYHLESGRTRLGTRLLALWLPVVVYFLCQVGHLSVPGAPSPIPRLSLRDAPGYISYMFWGAEYGVVLRGLTLFHIQKPASVSLVLILIAVLVVVCYRRISAEQRLSFWFLMVFLYTPSLLTGLGRLRFGIGAAASSRYAYLPSVAFTLLVVLCWEALRRQGTLGIRVFWNAAGLVLLAYYFAFHFVALRKQNPAADRGQQAQQFMAVAKRATYPDKIQNGELVLGPELRVPDYVCAPGPFSLWKAFQVLDGDTSKIVPVKDYLKDTDVPSSANLIPNGDFESPEQVAQWKSFGSATSDLTKGAARRGQLGFQLTLGPAAAFSGDVIDTCPSAIPQTIFTLSFPVKSNQGDALVARIISKDADGNTLMTAQSAPHPGNNQWEPLVVSGLSAQGTCVVSVDISNAGGKNVEASADDAVLVAHPGIAGPDGKISFRTREDIGVVAPSK